MLVLEGKIIRSAVRDLRERLKRQREDSTRVRLEIVETRKRLRSERVEPVAWAKGQVHDPGMMTDDEEYERRALGFADRLATMSDADVRDAYLASDAGAGNPWQTALAAECEARGIDL